MGHQHINEVSGGARDIPNSADFKSPQNWIYFGVALVAMILGLIFVNQWFWVALPFVMVYFVKAVDAI